MPRGQAPKIAFGKAKRSPSEQHKEQRPRSSDAFKMPMNKPKGQKEITTFCEEGWADGKSTLSLIRQFQEAECDHSRYEEVAKSPSKTISRCAQCGSIKVTAK